MNLNNIKVVYKLLFVLLVPIVAIAVTTAVSVVNITDVSESLVTDLYAKTSKSMELILNADRDFYQALSAQISMQTTEDPAVLKGLRESYYENTKQTVDRVNEAYNILLEDRSKLEKYTHSASNLTIYELFERFNSDYKTWYGLFDAEKNFIGNQNKFMDTFDMARERMNQIEEVLEVYGNEIINISNSTVNRIKTAMLLIALAAAVISLVLGMIIIRNIEKRTKKALGLISRTAELDLEENKESEEHTAGKDEFGMILKAEADVRKELTHVIKEVAVDASEVSRLVDLTNNSMFQLGTEIDEISATTEELSAGMEQTAASLQEMNATSNEIESAAEDIAEKAKEGSKAAEEISKRAGELSTSFSASRDSALAVFNRVKDGLESAIESSKATEQINKLADAILQITSQTKCSN
jgi:methyl-accepting chemotaxis protein